ncbi:MAG: CRISPR-associated helicase Cas3' [Anaerolineae bacterium]|nr:CRISPR-associated helicase Cas3' [Anaerolineae bacterium]MDQ7034320.1 CRISPR-associated helicase Cas3' [Anaerolineae bacterium]
MPSLWFHQQRVADLVADGKNIILQAPTGSGKTRAALFPFLDAFNDLGEAYGTLPRRCIYAVPMRILATQFNEEYKDTVKGYANRFGLGDIAVKTQTGARQDDRQFTGNLIFATIDQVLSSFLISPYSLSQRKANLNAGAVMSSYLVFDEFHLFDPNSTLPTTLHMLKMLKGITPFILMTATFSQTMLKKLAEELNAEIVGQSDEERAQFANLPSQQKTRFYHSVDNVLSADAILSKHKGRSLVICNQVERARILFENIEARLKEDGRETKVILLHSRLLAEHRKTREDSIRTHFGKDAKGGDYIVVSTQAIEVGVDMTSTVLHTELAPANAIIQRAGRCARYEDEEGHVFIYRKATHKGEETDLIENHMPYQGQGAVIAATWEAFADRDGQELKFGDEQDVLSAAHEEQDTRTIQWLREDTRNYRDEMYAVMRGDKNEDARNLIRHIVSQQVTIHDNPDEVAKNPFAYPSFGLHPGTVQRYLEDWLQREEYKRDTDIQAIRTNEDEDAAQSNDERYYAKPVIDARGGWMAQLLVVHPRLASYDPILGFIADRGGEWIAPLPARKNQSTSPNKYSYRLETYEKHIELVYQAFTEYWHEAEWAATKLEERFAWEKGSVTKAAQLAVLLHDVGKLSIGWQNWVRKYQKAIDMPIEKGAAYAHTELQNDIHREIERQMKRRPWHAVEGAWSVLDSLLDALNGNELLARAAYSAIARHHTAYSKEHQTYQLEDDAMKHIEAVFAGRMPTPDFSALYGVGESISFDNEVANYIVKPNEKDAFLAYLLIVRALRRADSKGTEQGSLP